MYSETLDRLEALRKAATPTPWHAGYGGLTFYVLDNQNTIDSEGRVATAWKR